MMREEAQAALDLGRRVVGNLQRVNSGFHNFHPLLIKILNIPECGIVPEHILHILECGICAQTFHTLQSWQT
jgi:hypothetical protein